MTTVQSACYCYSLADFNGLHAGRSPMGEKTVWAIVFYCYSTEQERFDGKGRVFLPSYFEGTERVSLSPSKKYFTLGSV